MKKKSGFTIVEVTLAMAFIGMLVIAVAMVLANMLALYQKGLVVKSVDSVGRGLVSELTTAINAAPSIDSTSLCTTLVKDANESVQLQKQNDCLERGAFEYIFQSNEGASEHDPSQPVQYNGVLCTGKYTYIWNTYRGIKTGKTLRLTYRDRNRNRQVLDGDFKLARFEDRNYRTCSSIVDRPGDFANGSINIETLPNNAGYYVEEPEEGFLDSTDVELYLYELTIFPVSQDVVTLRAFFSGTFILATNRGDVNILRTGDYCNPNAISEIDGGGNGSVFDLGSEFNYCAINKFNFAARTAGSGI